MRAIEEQAKQAFEASKPLAFLSSAVKNVALIQMADDLVAHAAYLIEENAKDLEAGKKAGLTAALLDRLLLDDWRIVGMAEGLRRLSTLADPIGEVIAGWTLPNGLEILKKRVPLGAIGIIYEARPNVTADAIGLCLKTGNSVVLRGSSTAVHSNKAIAAILTTAAEKAGIPSGAIQLLDDVTRQGVETFVKLNQYLSVIIPRGGADLIQSVVRNATVPTIETGIGNCHIFVDASADLANAVEIVFNSKVQRPSVCNSCETVLVHEAIAARFLTQLAARLSAAGVELRGCDQTLAILPTVKSATQDDWKSEYLDLILAIKIVSGVAEAIAHIGQYGTLHTESILSQDMAAISAFTTQVDAAAVMVNASTRFTDGGEFGFGAEMGISTQKLHARGPMGLPELTTYKYIVIGDGQVRG